MEIKAGEQKPSAKNAKIKMKATDGHPYRKEGEVFEVHPNHKEKLLANEWAVEENAKSTKAKNPAKPKGAGDNASVTSDEEETNKAQ